MTDNIMLSPAGRGELDAVLTALKALAGDLNDPFRAAPERLEAALFGAGAFGFALLARSGHDPLGVALAAPIFSTTGGSAMVYVSDLWVDPTMRRRRLGHRLLAATAREGHRRWQAVGLKLGVYSDNAKALAFYDRLGFQVQSGELPALLMGPAFSALREAAP